MPLPGRIAEAALEGGRSPWGEIMNTCITTLFFQRVRACVGVRVRSVSIVEEALVGGRAESVHVVADGQLDVVAVLLKVGMNLDDVAAISHVLNPDRASPARCAPRTAAEEAYQFASADGD